MADGLEVITQADFSAGAFPGYEDVPPNGVEDIVNGFVREDGAIERRGGTSFLSTATAISGPIEVLWDGFLVGGRRTVLQALDGSALVTYVLDGSEAPVQVASNAHGASAPVGRLVEVNGLLAFVRYGGQQVDVYGGSLKTSSYGTGTVTVTAGSKTVTGSGTSWSANVDAGMILRVTGQASRRAIVASVDSNTQITLRDEWPGSTASGVGYNLFPVLYVLPQQADDGSTITTPRPTTDAPGALASMYGRLIFAQKEKVWFSAAGDVRSWAADDYHELPQGAWVIGLEPLGSNLVVFTTAGAWMVQGLAFDLTDDFGNPQQTLQQFSRELVLWGDRGIANWEGALVVPGTSDLLLMAPTGELRPVTGGAARLYEQYVNAGYRPGLATVFNGHYILPVLDGTDVVDTLAWRLRSGAVTRWAGDFTDVRAMAVRPEADASPRPKLLAAGAARIRDATATLSPSASAKADADGTAHQLKVTSRSIMLNETQDHTLRFGRIRYELDDAGTDNPAWTAEWSRGRPGSSFTALAGSAGEGEGDYAWSLAKSGQQTRMRFTTNNAAAKAVLRAMEFKVRQHGRV